MKIIRFVTALLLLATASSSFGAAYLYTEAADQVRFEQYAGTASTGPLVLWRMPTPGSSTFPGGTCTHLNLSSTATTEANRFMAMYMFVKTNSSTYFVQYETTTCNIISFGMDG